ncbi:signal peptidase I [Cohnella kolymensis]|uniref:Signal peptidase I n=1 Tax=Cohnella kolymensis TaxID=1590652 RepID=A0ABR5A8Q9_9BACL|nr:signal peptidase I [Cohnella kolymensis]KIL37425.1 signal peptidase I [Cohnella kolymensis]
MINQTDSSSPPRGRARGTDKPRMTGWRKELWDWAIALIVALVIVLLLRAFVFQLSTVKSYSMEPTLYEKEWLFINKIVYEFGKPERGDIVIFKDPGPDDKQYLVKRIIGVPGDTLEIRNGQLYRNGQLTIEPYTDSKIEYEDVPAFKVSPGHYFVMGDNRRQGASRDSRHFKEISENIIKGRADVILWPITRWAWL